MTKIKTKTAKRQVIEGKLTACAHYINWWLATEDEIELTDQVRESLENRVEERVRECIADDYHSGQLVETYPTGDTTEADFLGWWDIDRS